MEDIKMGIRLIKLAVFYFVIGVLMGMYMSMVGDHSLSPVHVHLNLLGWVSLAINGVIYHILPLAAKTRLGKAHIWVYNIGVPLMMIGLAGYILGFKAIAPFIPVGGILTVLGAILFFLNVMINIKLTAAEPNQVSIKEDHVSVK
jgi:cbb3-type cytochrome oxidase subunit 1